MNKRLIIISLLFFASPIIGYSQAAHNTNPSTNCKYARNPCRNMEGCSVCNACVQEDRKELAARQQALLKMDAAARARYKAQQAAKVAERERALKAQKLEQEVKLAEEKLAIAKQAQIENERLANVAKANKGLVASPPTTKQPTTSAQSNVSCGDAMAIAKRVEVINDDASRVSVLKLDGKTIFSQNYDAEEDRKSYVSFDMRLPFFTRVSYAKKNTATSRDAILLNHNGQKQTINGFDKFTTIGYPRTGYNSDTTKLQLDVVLSESDFLDDKVIGLWFNTRFYASTDAVIAAINGIEEIPVGYYYDVGYVKIMRIIIDCAGKILSSTEGYLINYQNKESN